MTDELHPALRAERDAVRSEAAFAARGKPDTDALAAGLEACLRYGDRDLRASLPRLREALGAPIDGASFALGMLVSTLVIQNVDAEGQDGLVRAGARLEPLDLGAQRDERRMGAWDGHGLQNGGGESMFLFCSSH